MPVSMDRPRGLSMGFELRRPAMGYLELYHRIKVNNQQALILGHAW